MRKLQIYIEIEGKQTYVGLTTLCKNSPILSRW